MWSMAGYVTRTQPWDAGSAGIVEVVVEGVVGVEGSTAPEAPDVPTPEDARLFRRRRPDRTGTGVTLRWDFRPYAGAGPYWRMMGNPANGRVG